MNWKPWKDDDPLKNNCWSAVFEQRPKSERWLLGGDIIIRRRDEASTKCLMAIPVGGERGVPKKKAGILADIIIETLNRKGT